MKFQSHNYIKIKVEHITYFIPHCYDLFDSIYCLKCKSMRVWECWFKGQMKRLAFHGERKNEEIIGQKIDNNIERVRVLPTT